MIYCILKGGLANMLFQIAAAKAFSLEKKVECSFPNFSQHLNFLNTEKVYNPKLNYAEEYKLFLNLKTDLPKAQIKLYNYPFEYKEFIPLEDDYAVDGFFQSEKYFLNFRKEIIDFINLKIFDNVIEKKYESILNKKCVSVHVRRGDYVNLSSHHRLQNLEYYQKSLSYIFKNGACEQIIVFSDDIEWCKQNFKDFNCFFVENEKDYIEIQLMSKCTHNIISNSSFSWWGAWLNENPDKIVISPINWFGESLSHLNTKDIYPTNWIKL